MKTASDICAHAGKLVGGARAETHGISKEHNFRNIAQMWNAYIAIRRAPGEPLSAEDVGHMMGLMKVARTQFGAFNPDDYVDAVGYAACTGEIALSHNSEPKDMADRDIDPQAVVNEHAARMMRGMQAGRAFTQRYNRTMRALADGPSSDTASCSPPSSGDSEAWTDGGREDFS